LTGTFANDATVASTATTVTVGDANMIQPGHILLIGTEQVWVSARSSSVITISRAYAGTAASFDSVAAFTIVGMARLEGDDSDSLGYTDITQNSNYTQIFHQQVQVSGTEQAIDNYGMSDPFQYQAAKAIPSQMRLIERALQYGQRKAGSATTPRAMGGYSTFITDNLVSGSTLAQSQFEDALEAAYNDGGGNHFVAICSPASFQGIKNFYDDSAYLRIGPEQTTVGMQIKNVLTPFGMVDLVLDRWQLNTLIPLIDVNNMGMLTLRPWQVEPLAKTGDSEKQQLIGEFTLCVKQDKSHAMLTNVSI